jgi:hypothetical protein
MYAIFVWFFPSFLHKCIQNLYAIFVWFFPYFFSYVAVRFVDCVVISFFQKTLHTLMDTNFVRTLCCYILRLFIIFCVIAIMTRRPFEKIKDIDDTKSLWRIAVRVKDLWVVRHGKTNNQHFEMVVCDELVTIINLVYILLYLSHKLSIYLTHRTVSPCRVMKYKLLCHLT